MTHSLTYENVAVLIPALNEEASIQTVVTEFRSVLPHSRIFVFDNNSTDKTADRAREVGATVVSSPRRGKGCVVRHMFEVVDADYYLMVDGDDTYPSSRAGELVQACRTLGVDMLVGT